MTPRPIVNELLSRSIYLKPGMDTRSPERAALKYRKLCAEFDLPFQGSRAMVMGYGGSVRVAVHLLEAGVAAVILQDPFAPRRHALDKQLGHAETNKYFEPGPEGLVSRDGRVQFAHAPLTALAEQLAGSVDLIVSNSVLEHVGDVDEVAAVSGRLLRPGGACLHSVDLRDHYFRYPFEMLCYSERVWLRWLNASNHLNRLRVPDFERIWGKHFARVVARPEANLLTEFLRAKPRIRPEFLTGEDELDASSKMTLVAQEPRLAS